MQSRPTEIAQPLSNPSPTIETLIQNQVISSELAALITDEVRVFLEKQDFSVLTPERVERLRGMLPLLIYGYLPAVDSVSGAMALESTFNPGTMSDEDKKALLDQLHFIQSSTDLTPALIEFIRSRFLSMFVREKTVAAVLEEIGEYIASLPADNSAIMENNSVKFLLRQEIITEEVAATINRALLELLRKQDFATTTEQAVVHLRILMPVLLKGYVQAYKLSSLNVSDILNDRFILNAVHQFIFEHEKLLSPIRSSNNMAAAFKPLIQVWILALLKKEKTYEQVQLEYKEVLRWLRSKMRSAELTNVPELPLGKVKTFIKIYNALRDGQSSIFKSNWVKDHNLNELASAAALELITQHAANNSQSRTSQAWNLCEKYYAGEIDANGLKTAVYLAAFDLSTFKKSSHYGQTFYRSKSLHAYVENSSRSSLVQESAPGSRMEKISLALK